jgi:imidazolonepropionase-like amidohydrolase
VSRTILAGGRVFDGAGAPVRDADVVIEGGRIVEVGPGLDGDEVVDVAGSCLLPGLFDCHTHVTLGDVNLLGHLQRPFSYRFYQAVGNLAATLAAGITTVRDAAGADAGVKRAVADGLVPGPRMQVSLTLLSRPAGTATAGSRPARRSASGRSTPACPTAWSTDPKPCAARSASWSAPAPT